MTKRKSMLTDLGTTRNWLYKTVNLSEKKLKKEDKIKISLLFTLNRGTDAGNVINIINVIVVKYLH